MSLRDKMLAVISEVSGELAERDELIELIAIALLTRNNLFILGKPGQAKSQSINLFRQRITGAKQFERQLSKQADEEQLFGRIDLSSLIPGSVPESVFEGDSIHDNLSFDLRAFLNGFGNMTVSDDSFKTLQKCADRLSTYRSAVAALHQNEPVVNTAGKIPEADIVFIDEIFKANDGILNSLLAAFNERKYTNEGRTYTIPTVSFFTASNEIPNFSDPQEKSLEALYDRLQIKVITEDISERDNRLAVLKKKQSGQVSGISASFTLEELYEMQKEVSQVIVPDSINELADEILCELRRAGVTVSDRKYLNYYPLAQAKAWLSGKAKVDFNDLLILKCYLWQKPSELSTVEAVLNRLCVNPMQTKVDEVRSMAAEMLDTFNEGRAGGANKALIKLRGEIVRLYRQQQKLEAEAQSENEMTLVNALLEELEKINKDAHETVGFTYAPLKQLEALQ